MSNRVIRPLLSLIIAVFVAAPLAGQAPTSARELGMGGAYVAVARGYESIFLSPANLGVPGAPSWSVGIFQPAFGVTLRGPDPLDLVDLAQFDDLAGERQDELLSLIPLGGTEGSFTGRVPLAAISYGGFGVGVQYVSTGSHSLSRDLTELFLEGYEEGRTDYSVGQTAGQRASHWDLALGYGRQIGPVSVGATAHYFRGGSLVRTRLFEPRIDIEARTIEVDYIGVRTRGGTGYGIDLGAAFSPSPRLTVSGALSNAFSRMQWSEDLHARSLTIDRELIDDVEPGTLNSRYIASEIPLDPESSSLQVLQTAEGLYQEAYFPTTARLGLGWAPTSSTVVAADYHHEVTGGRLGDDWSSRMSIGVQQELWLLKVRAGYAIGSEGGNLLGGGLSIGPLDLGLVRYQRSQIDGDRTGGYIATFGLGVSQP